MWACPFCKSKNEDSEICAQCGAHRPVDMSLDEVRRIVKRPIARIVGLRVWMFAGAALCFAFAAVQYNRVGAFERYIARYHASCASPQASSQECVLIPATYQVGSAQVQGQDSVVEITPKGQSVFPLSIDASGLPQTGQGNAVFWRGKLTALSTPLGFRETNLSPEESLQEQQAAFLRWILLGLFATIVPFFRGWAFRVEYEIADDAKRGA